jgi:hypothetical protein
MITNKTSLLIPNQLPEFIRENPDYEKFVLFLQAYYEWMEETGNVTDRSKNILNYIDIDRTSNEFLDYFYNDFLSYFPVDVLTDKKIVTKIAKELYKTKGTPASYKFLFRILYNSDVDFFYTKDAVLRASAGKWYVSKSLNVKSDNINFLAAANYRIFGETTKSIAVIENTTFTKNKTEIFISNIERLFQSGEYVRVVDNNDQDVYFLNGVAVSSDTIGATILRGKIVGQISQIKINPEYRGELYQTGDPVIAYGALESENGIGATATVGETTTGSIQRIVIDNGGYGYVYAPTVTDSNTGAISTQTVTTAIQITNAPGAQVRVASVDPDANVSSNVSFISVNYIGSKASISIGSANYAFKSYTTNANTTIANTLNFISFTGSPISSLIIDNHGGGIKKTPVITADTQYSTLYSAGTSSLKNLGILSPILIINGGNGYRVNDKIVFSGGSGYGAYANVISVDPSTNAITSIKYVYPTNDTPHKYSLGGMGYKTDSLPLLSVNSANTLSSNAVLIVPGIMGDGAVLTPITDRAGSITTITINNYGEDYIGTPNVSIRVQDIVVANVDYTNIAQKGDIVYQGANVDVATFKATVDSVSLLVQDYPPSASRYRLRVFNYTSKANNFFGSLNVDGKSITMDMSNKYTLAIADDRYDTTSGVLIYGDGTAKATASFLNGLVIGNGKYLDSTGHPSSYDVLQSENFNNFTYEITVGKEIEKYRKVLLDLLHPTGLKVLGRYAVKVDNRFNLHLAHATQSSQTLGFYTGNPGSSAAIVGDFTNQSSNTIQFDGLSGSNTQGFIFPNESFISISNSYGQLVYSKVVNVTPEYTNLLRYSEYFDNAAWVKYGTTSVTADATTSPNGGVNADRVTLAASSGIYQAVSSAAATTYTISIWIRADSAQSVNLISNTNLSEVTTLAVSVTTSWQRVTLQKTTTTGTIVSLQVSTGGSGATVYLWGAQIVTGTVARDYVPSTTTFVSRANTGTYFAANGTLQTAAINIPRYQYNPANLSAPPFLLLEPAANNLLTYSEDFRNTAEVGSTRPWTQFNDGASDNVAVNLVSTVNPTGAISLVSKLTQNSSVVTSQRQVSQTQEAIANNTIYTFSVFAKAQEVKNIQLLITTREPLYPGIVANLVTGIVTSVFSPNVLNYGIINCGNGWYRCWATANVFSGSQNAGMNILQNSTSLSQNAYHGNVGDGVLLWGAQAELGYTPTSYIPTTTVQTTRAADNSTSTSTIKYATATLEDNVWVTFANVASVTGVSGNNRLNISYLTGSYDIINNGEYSNTSYPLYDIVRSGDKILVANNTVRTVSSVDPVNNLIVLTSNLTSNANSFMTVNRNIYETDGAVRIYGPLGVQYIPELITEDGRNIITEDGFTILIG